MRRSTPLVAGLALLAALLPFTALPAQAENTATGSTTSSRDQRVSVMLELDTSTSAQAFTRARSRGQSQRSAAIRQSQQVDGLATEVSRRLDVSTEVLYTTSVLYAGVAVQTSMSKVHALGNIPGVRAVHTMVPKSVAHAVSVPLTGAPTTWANPGGTGAGVTIGIIDTGIDYTHADFGGPGLNSDYLAAKVAQASGEAPDYPDRAKVAGGFDFAGDAYDADNPNSAVPQPDPNPLDCYGHGTHVAGTAAGYGVLNSDTYTGAYNRITPLDTFDVAPGMAPRATLYALKVFGCTGTTLLIPDALDWAADPNGDGDPSDHLDVVNMSLGSSFGPPDDPDAVATQAAVRLGISVVASAGNNGDLYETAGSPANAPGAISVASTMTNELVYDTADIDYGGGAVSSAVGYQDVTYPWLDAADAASPGLSGTLTLWPAALWSSPKSAGCESPTQQDFAPGQVALLYWSDTYCGSSVATRNARLAGASGVLFVGVPTPIWGDSQAAADGVDPIPAFISASFQLPEDVATGAQIQVTSDLSNRATARTTRAVSATGIQSSFSSRGIVVPGVAKPDVSAPGESILSAGMATGAGGESLMGTSMASPHVAGLAALVIAAHPRWSPTQVKAAIMNNATKPVTTGADDTGLPYAPTRAGAGGINAPAALQAQSVLMADNSNGSVGVSFGTVEAATDVSVSRDVTITNLRPASTPWATGASPLSQARPSRCLRVRSASHQAHPPRRPSP